MLKIPVLFAQKRSHYEKLPGTDIYNIERNALSIPRTNTTAGIYHPPCRHWGQLKHFAKPRPGERKLAIWSVLRINRYGGVLEHPYNSELFSKYSLLMNKGFILPIEQVWFGHKARKPTKLYIVGIDKEELPPFEVIATEPTHQVSGLRYRGYDQEGNLIPNRSKSAQLPELSKKAREATPPKFGEWLLQICRTIEAKKSRIGQLYTQGQHTIYNVAQ